jgi:hypothetical protein
MPLNATDCLGPSFEHTRAVLLRPFRFWGFLKLAAVAALADGCGGFSCGGYNPGARAHTQQQFASLLAGGRGLGSTGAPEAGAVAAGVALVLGLLVLVVALPLWWLLLYLFCRLKLAFFHLVAFRERSVGAAWRPYGRQTWQYFRLLLVLGLVTLAACALACLPFLPVLHRVAAAVGDGAAGQGGALLPLFVALVPLALLLLGILLLAWLVQTTAQDFLLPALALERGTLGDAWQRFASIAGAEKRRFAGYYLLRVLVDLGAALAAMTILFVPVLLAALVFGGIGVALWVALGKASLAGRAAVIAYGLLAGAAFLAGYVFMLAVSFGVTNTFKRSFATLFWGSHFAPLGAVLRGPEAAAGSVLPLPAPPGGGLPPPAPPGGGLAPPLPF